MAAKNGAHNAIVTFLEQEISKSNEMNKDIVAQCLQAANSLTNKQPDIFDAEALSVILKLLQESDLPENLLCLSLQWLQKACIMHEMNRQNIMSSNLISHLKMYVNKKASDKLMKDLTAVLRYLVLDDDIRVEFGHAHEHARQIASELIVDLTKLLAGKLRNININVKLLFNLMIFFRLY